MHGMTVLLAVAGLFSRRRRESVQAQEDQGAFIRCPACRKELHSTIPRCPYCSAFLQVTCPNCDRTSNRSNTKCPYCGTFLR